MRRYWPIAVALVFLLAVGFIHSRWTDESRYAADVQAAVARLTTIPDKIGDWKGEDAEIPEGQRKVSGADGFFLRHYKNPATDQMITVLIVCGRPGPIAVHTPDVCYQAVGNFVGSPESRALEYEDSKLANFKEIRVKGAEHRPGQPELDVLWSWSTDGNWTTPRFPRLSFARARVLHKLYVIRQVDDSDSKESDMSPAFIRMFLGEARKHLFPDQ
jgi:hypothetical protein